MARNPLADAKTQEMIVEFVREAGQEEANFLDQDGTRIKWACFDGICSDTAYYKFKKKNPDFQEQITQAKQYYRQQQLLQVDPKKRQDLIDAIARECREGYVTKKIKERADIDGNIIETTTETIIQPPREFIFRALLLEK